MKNYSKKIFLLVLSLTLIHCSSGNDSSENPQNNDDYFVQMFSGIVRFGFETIPNDNSIYIRTNIETLVAEFIRIDESGNTTTTDISSIAFNNSAYIDAIFYDFNNQINIVVLEEVNPSESNIKMISLDYNGTLINQQTLETNTIYTNLRIHSNGFLAYTEISDLQEHTLNYKIFNQSGNPVNTQIIDFGADNPRIDDVYFENNNVFVIGKNNWMQGQGYTNQICRVYNSNGELINSHSFDFIYNSNNVLRVLNNRIHRSYNAGLGTEMEVYDIDGVLINATTLNHLLNFSYNSIGQFMYVEYNSTLNKNLDFKILDSQLESEIYSRNFGADNSTGNTGTTWVFSIKETENFYKVFGQTTAPKNGDFDLPENSSSFDDYLARFNKN
ncbi:hypothetical protein [Winogradskyella sp.]|uniref:hypothetical protein n=1 Tax=Winogradskyella sp. TaxID=1883156 RepID=UPI00260A0ACE|nr:hypothetical protein [Winogradskyella sp.]